MKKRETIIGLVLGAVSLLICWIINTAFLALPIAIVGFIISIKARKTIKLSGFNTSLINTAIVLNTLAGFISGVIIIEFVIYHLIKLFVSSTVG